MFTAIESKRFETFWKITSWIFAGFAALVLNLAFISLLPSLVDNAPGRPENLEKLRKVNVVRVKRPESPVRKKEPKPLKKKEPEKKPDELKKVVKRKRIKTRIVPIPFELNTRLPPLPGSLPTPDIKMVEGPNVGMKDSYDMGELDQTLIPLAQVPPVYPLRAKRREIEGWVDVKFLVTKQGTVDRVEILNADPENVFEQSVIRCVSSWRFKPGTVEGIPVKTWVQTRIRFKLE